ncbi:MAG: hypothetical protein MK198_01250 [Gracilimonas sp.]|uniref:hypothetical protein n=1 Tax=Gracilimonas sp. TaxID=1974203 RepID=UPI0037511FD7|nr:hypothetical protein [Gracilimonas sp.]
MKPKIFSKKFDYNKSRQVFWIQDKLRARKMSLNQAFGQPLNEYQPLKEQECMERLRKQYDVVPNFSQLSEAYQKDS